MDIWKPVVGWEGVYSVSDTGRVRYEQDRPSYRYAVRAGFILPQFIDPDGYAVVQLARLGERAGRRSKRVATLVIEAFVGPSPSPDHEVNHKNSCRLDNEAGNLEWVTGRENVQHAIRVGMRHSTGDKCPSAKLTTKQVIAIRERAITGETFTSIAADFAITIVNASKIATGKTWVAAGGPISKPRDTAEKKRLGILNR